MDGKNLILFLLCINIMLYLGGYNLVNDPLSSLIDKSKLSDGTVSYNEDLQETFPQQTVEGVSSETSIGFVDGLGVIWDFIKILFNLVTSVFALLISFPTIITLMFGLPIGVLYILVIVSFIRGVQI